MQDPPKQKYRVVQRHGRLAVEPDAAGKPRLLPRLSIPLIRFPTELVWKGGRDLFAWKCNPELDTHGNAIVFAGDLKDLIELDARSGDQYYVTERQQALFGYLLYGSWVLIPLGVFGLMFVRMFSLPLVVLLLVLAALIAGYIYTLWAEVQAIHGQRYFPEDWPMSDEGPVEIKSLA